MTIYLYKCLSDNNVLNKSFASDEGDVLTLTGALRAPCSVMDPVVTVEMTLDNADIVHFNYMEIAEFGRKYFIREISSTNNGLWEIHAHIDVLETYKTEISACHIFAQEREGSPDMYINDGQISMEDRTVDQVIFFKGTDENCYHHDGEGTSGNTCFSDSEWNYILITQGPGVTVPPPTPTP